MRMCSITGVYPPERIGGVSEVAYNLQKYLRKEGVKVVVLTSGKQNEKYPNVIRISQNTSFFLIKSFVLLPRILKKSNIDIFHFQGSSGAGVILWKLFFRKKFPKTITTLHTSSVREMVETRPLKIKGKTICKLSKQEYIFKYLKSPLNIILDFLVTHLSDRVISVCEQTKKDCTADYFLPINKQSVIYNGIEAQKFNPKFDGSFIRSKYNLNDNPIILFIGVFKVRKRIPLIFYALIDIIKKNPKVKLIIIGGKWGYSEQLIALCKRLKLEKNVIFAGKVSDKEIPKYYASSDVVLVPSSYEGFPLVILESMASGKPVIATNVGGISEVVIDEKTGFLIDKDNISQLIEKTLFLIRNDKNRKEMGKNARKRVIEDFSWEKIAKQYKIEYQQLLKDSITK